MSTLTGETCQLAVERGGQQVEHLLHRLAQFYSPEELDLVARAYLLAEERHRPQVRSSGEPYITHPVAVADILADYRLDAPTLAATLLHDTVEDTPTTLEELSAMFGEEIAMLVDGVTKLTSISSRQGRDAPTPRSKQQAQAENLRKIFLAMARDLRVILIKLADRLHNLRTLGALRPQKQEAIATETLEIFAPIASRLGVFQMKIELEDLSFRYRYPKEYAELVEGLHELRPVLERAMEEARQQLQQRLGALQIQAKLEWREKHLYSTFRKIQRTQRPLQAVINAAQQAGPQPGDQALVRGGYRLAQPQTRSVLIDLDGRSPVRQPDHFTNQAGLTYPNHIVQPC